MVLSPAFLHKKWAEYELRGLTAREISEGKVILPVWHNVTHDDILQFSPPLADKLAVKADGLRPAKIAVAIIEAVRPDIFRRILRRISHLNTFRNLKPKMVETARIKISPIRHESLPPHLVSRIRLVRASLLSSYPHSMAYWLSGFKRDTHPSDEIAYWEHLAAVYQEYLGLVPKPLSGKERMAVFQYIFVLQTKDKKAIAECAKALPNKAASKVINDLYSYSQPIYDFAEEFPSEDTKYSSEEYAELLSRHDKEHFPKDLPDALIHEIMDNASPHKLNQRETSVRRAQIKRKAKKVKRP